MCDFSEYDSVLDTGAHALPAGWAVLVGGIAGQQDAAPSIRRGDSMGYPRARHPGNRGDPCGCGRPDVDQHLELIAGGCDRGGHVGGHDAAFAVGQRFDHHGALRRQEVVDRFIAEVGGHLDVGKKEVAFVVLTDERDLDCTTYRTPATVGTYHEQRADKAMRAVGVVDLDVDAVGALAQSGERPPVTDLCAQRGEASSRICSVRSCGTNSMYGYLMGRSSKGKRSSIFAPSWNVNEEGPEVFKHLQGAGTGHHRA